MGVLEVATLLAEMERQVQVALALPPELLNPLPAPPLPQHQPGDLVPLRAAPPLSIKLHSPPHGPLRR